MSPSDDRSAPIDAQVPSRRSAAPPLIARVAAFASVLIAGLCGGLIGYAVTDIQFNGDRPVAAGIGGLIGALGCAVGVAIVASLVLRSMGEWKETR